MTEAETGVRVTGQVLHADRVRILGIELADLVAYPEVRDGVVHLAQVEAKAYGGLVRGAVAFDLRSDTIDLHLDLVELSVAKLANELEAGDTYAGILDGRLDLVLEEGLWRQARGDGRLVLRNGSVISIPFLAELLFGNAVAERGQDRGEVTFTVSDGNIAIKQGSLRNPSVNVALKGGIASDGRLDIKVRPIAKPEAYKIIPGIGHWMSLIVGGLAGQAARLDIRGYITNPEVVYRPY